MSDAANHLTDPAEPASWASEPNQDGRNARWEDHRTARRRDLISGARKAIHRLGPNVSMEDIAAASGTSKSVYYRYFGDKTGLQQAVALRVVEQMREKIVAAGRTADTPKNKLAAMVKAYLHMAQSSPNVYAFVSATPEFAAPALRAEGPTHLKHFMDAIADMFAEPLGQIYQQTEPARSGSDDAHSPEALTAEVPTQEALTTQKFWPQAAIGMVRAAGEMWIAAPSNSGKPSEETLAELITEWLYASIVVDQPLGMAKSLPT